MSRPDYKVVGSKKKGFGVVTQDGAIEYDLLETRGEAEEICDILNAGIGPDWVDVSAEIDRRAKEVACTPATNTTTTT